MSNTLSIRSIDDLAGLKRGNLASFLNDAAGTLKSLEGRIEEIANKRVDVQNKESRAKLWFMLFIIVPISALFIDFEEPNLTLYVFLFGAFLFAILFVAIVTISILRAGRKAKASHAKLDAVQAKVIQDFENELQSAESLIAVIPGKFLASYILEKFCEYLNDGEADGWKECIERFRRDEAEMRKQQRHIELMQNLDEIKRYTKSTARWAALMAWNTR